MDNQRLFLYIGLIFILALIWQAWEADYGAGARQRPAVAEQQPAPGAVPEDRPSLPATSGPDLPVTPEIAQTEAEAAARIDSTGQVRVVTDTLDVVIDLKGGTITRADLPQYPVSVDEPDVPFRLMATSYAKYFVAQSGLLGNDNPAPDHYAQFSATANEFRLAEGIDTLEVPLSWTDPSGLKVTKTYVFKRDAYVVDVRYTIDNATDNAWTGRLYRQLQRSPAVEGATQKFIYTYTGAVIYSEAEKYEKVSFEDMEENQLNRTFAGGWAAMIQHYFLAAWIPDQQTDNTYYSKVLNVPEGKRYIVGIYSPSLQVGAQSSATVSSRLFLGPKDQDRMDDVAEGLRLTVDYGWLTIIAYPLFLALRWIHGFVGNWGWAIIILTIAIKAVFYKLSEASYKSMAKMRKLQPRMQALKERYGDDRQRMGQATMELYKKEKINPLGGCLPILVQIPVFIALYWMLLESVELRQAPFMLWIQDMSTKDPYYILPLIMGVTMFIQQKLNPAPVDPLQAKIFMALPLVFTVFFAFFPSGLVLYWVVNNILSIAQQYYITRYVIGVK